MNLRCLFSLEHLLVILQELVVSLVRVILNHLRKRLGIRIAGNAPFTNKTYLTEMVGASWIHDIHENDHPVVEKSSVASEEAVNWNLSAS